MVSVETLEGPPPTGFAAARVPARPEHVLVVEDHQPIWDVIAKACRNEPWALRFVPSGEEALEEVARGAGELDAMLVDIRLPGMDGVQVLREAHEQEPILPVVMLSALGEADMVVRCMKSGAYDYVTKPFRDEDLVARLRRAIKTRALLRAAVGPRSDGGLRELMGPSRAIAGLGELLGLVSVTEMAVLIEGESGTGKEILSRRIHDLSPRREGPFIPVDCGAIPETLLESELFGSRKGSFTGATIDRIGKFQAADGGTLFLDEIGNFPLDMQVKLLRALQEKEVTPIGAYAPVPVNVRIVAATNCSLRKAVDDGSFRLDLFHRIAEFPIHVPPLRERLEDLVDLAFRFLREAALEFGKRLDGLSVEAIHELIRYPWPGNARELRSVMRRSALLATAPQVERLSVGLSAARDRVRSTCAAAGGVTIVRVEAVIRNETIREGRVPFKDIHERVTREIDRGILERVLAEVGGNLGRAAEVLGLDYKTVQTKTKKLGIVRSARREQENGP